jgi:methylated-DNA-[protein]-cysteine S-methyltransferase
MGATFAVESATGFLLFDTAVGVCGLAWRADGWLAGVQLPEDRGPSATRKRMQQRFPRATECSLEPDTAQPAPAAVLAVVTRVTALLAGGRDDLADIALDMAGVPPFHQRVYEVARAITPGRTMTYGEVAAQLGEPGAARAVGQALGHNPFAPIVPCHRVLAAGSQSGGFSAGGGVATKLKMLEAERAQFGGQPGLF